MPLPRLNEIILKAERHTELAIDVEPGLAHDLLARKMAGSS